MFVLLFDLVQVKEYFFGDEVNGEKVLDRRFFK